MADDFQNELKFLGMESSPSFVREPEGNGCAERFIRLLKENLLWVRTFDTIEELRLALIEFKNLYKPLVLVHTDENHNILWVAATNSTRITRLSNECLLIRKWVGLKSLFLLIG